MSTPPTSGRKAPHRRQPHRRQPHPQPPHARAAAATALACIAGALPALAAPPLATDDAQVLAAHDCEAELYAQRLNLPARLREDTINTQLGCGLGHGVQAALTGGRSSRPDNQNNSRRDALALAAKGLLHTAPDGATLALAGGSVMGRTGTEAFRFDSAYLTAIVSAGLGGGLTAHANLGVVRSRAGGQYSTTWNLALEGAATEAVEAGLELYGDDRRRPWLGSGLRWSATPWLKLGAAYAVQSDSLRQRLWQLGLTAAF